MINGHCVVCNTTRTIDNTKIFDTLDVPSNKEAMVKINVKYVPSNYKAKFAFTDLARTKLKAIKWIRFFNI